MGRFKRLALVCECVCVCVSKSMTVKCFGPSRKVECHLPCTLGEKNCRLKMFC